MRTEIRISICRDKVESIEVTEKETDVEKEEKSKKTLALLDAMFEPVLKKSK